jgi:cytochrome bd-type quinol oxidase subunit 1
MLGLGLLTILLLVWNAWWVHKRGRFGRKASAASLYPIVLGLGVRCLGALIGTIVGAAGRKPAPACPRHIAGLAG